MGQLIINQPDYWLEGFDKFCFNPCKSVLAGVPNATLQLWLSGAQNAYNQLMIGGKPVKASYTQGDGVKQVEFTPTNATALMGYILLLQSQLGLIRRARRPLNPLFLS